MCMEPSAQRVEDGRQDQWQGEHRQDDVADENAEVDGPYDALSGKRGVAVEMMVNEIAGQKERRKDERGQHALFVSPGVAAFDVDEAGRQADRGQRIQAGVGRGQEI